MSKSLQYQLFWSNSSPLSCLSGAALLVMASGRLAHAVTVAAALLWVYCLTSLAAFAGARIFPKQGKTVLIAFLAAFITSLYLLLLWVYSPFCFLESFFVIALIPMFCMDSGIFKRLQSMSVTAVLKSSGIEALLLGILIIIFALVREPLGYSSLSLPGGAQGIVLLFSSEKESFLPIHLAASASGALLFLGYCLGFYRYLKTNHSPREDQ